MIRKEKMNKLKSTCCKAEVKFSNSSPDFFGDKSETMTIGTCYCICSKCGEPCNIMSVERKLWKRNPKTQIKKDKRNKIHKKEIDKEIQEIGNA
jgi:hypothetical protein